MSRVLWVDDESKIELIQYKTPLIRGGYRVDIAADATEAVQLLREEGYDSIILDLVIPSGWNFETDTYYVGFELLKKLINGKINGIGKHDPSCIIIFSAVNPCAEILKNISELGVETILNKRLCELDLLRNHVDRILK